MRIQKLQFFVYSVMAALVLFSTDSFAGSAARDNSAVSGYEFVRPEKPVSGKDIIDKQMTRQRAADVIVTLDMDLPAVSDKNNYQKIGHLQQRLLNSSEMSGAAVKYVYENVPAVSLKADSKALDFLLKSELVAGIEAPVAMQAHTLQGVAVMGAEEYRDTYNGSGVAIAVLDSGIDYTHEAFGGASFPNDKVIGGYDFGNDDGDPIPVEEGHGTNCAGIAAGDETFYQDYIGGVSPASKLYAVKVMPDNSGSTDSAKLVAAIDWCISHKYDDPNNPIKVISMSLGGGRYFDQCAGVSATLANAASAANAAGITLLASSGNDGFCDAISFPSCMPGVISVGAVFDANIGTASYCLSEYSCIGSSSDNCQAPMKYYSSPTSEAMVTGYSNSSPLLDVLASAENAYTPDIKGTSGNSVGDYFGLMGGTSAACAYAAGAVGSLQQAAIEAIGRFLSPQEVIDILSASGTPTVDNKNAVNTPLIDVAQSIDLTQSLETGDLQIIITPQEAADAGAQWRRKDSNIWLDSGDTDEDILAGTVDIEFRDASGWQSSGTISAEIQPNQLTQITAEYTESNNILLGNGTELIDFPLFTYYHDARTQSIYLASEMSGDCTITSLSLDVAAVPGQRLDNFTIRMKHTSMSEYDSSSGWQQDDWTVVYQSDEDILETGWIDFSFSELFEYNGNDNLMIDFSFDNDSWSESGLCRYTERNSARSLFYFSDSEDGDPLSWAQRIPEPIDFTLTPNLKLDLIAGSGTAANPYQISNFQQLELVNTDLSANYILTEDIDLSDRIFETAVIAAHQDDPGKGYVGTPFTGSFDGNGHTITGLTINTDSRTASYLALFGQIAAPATIKDLAVEQASIITGHDSWFIGGVCGENYGATISGCYGDITVTTGSSSWYIGGICGQNYTGDISESYALGDISAGTGSVAVGGFCGESYQGSIADSYSAAKVQAGRNSMDIGGFCGYKDGGLITEGFWDLEVSGQLESSGGVWKTTAQMTAAGTFIDSGWDYQQVWKQLEGSYPALSWQEIILDADINDDGIVNTADFSILASQWLKSESGLSANIYFDNQVSELDLFIMAQQWLE